MVYLAQIFGLCMAILIFWVGLSVGISDDALKVVPASEILAKIQKGEPVKYDHIKVKGDLDLAKLHLQQNVTSPIRINDSTFDGFVSYNNTNLDESIDLSGSNFTKDAWFRNSTFRGQALFNGTKFSGSATFDDSIFNGFARFSNSIFNGKFNANANFGGDADFGNSTFNDIADFWGARFGYAYFGDSSVFNDEAYFGSAKFKDKAIFRDALFKKRANFNDVQFKEDAVFENTIFENVLSLDRSSYNKLYIKLDNIKSLHYDDAAYMSLMKNFKDLGYFEDYDNLYYQYRTEQFKRRSFWEDPLIYASDLLAGAFYGYGKRPLYPLIWSIAIVLVFGFFWIALGSKKTKSAVDEYSSIKKWPGNLSDALIFSATVFLSGTKLFVDPPPVPEIDSVSPSFVRKAFTIERLLGALFSVLFFLAVTGMIIKPT